MRKAILVSLALAALMASSPAQAGSINAADREASATRPFEVQEVARFHTPWAIAFLPDGRMLITEKPGHIFLVSQDGQKVPVEDVPQVAARRQNGLLDIAIAPDFASSRRVYFTYSEPAEGGSRVVLASATLTEADGHASLKDQAVLWRQQLIAKGGQPGGVIAFDPEGKHLFLTLGDRMQTATAQDPDAAAGKLLRLNLDGSTPADNPEAEAGGIRAETWTTGHRNAYGLAFAPDGKLWSHEMGPKGGDELNLIEPGKNYGWPVVSNGDNYNGTPIPRHDTRPEFAAPVVYWNPVIAPAGMVFYSGSMFPDWQGTALIGGLKARALVQVAFKADGSADETNLWPMDGRIRDVAVAPDGAVWLIEDADPGRLLRLAAPG